MTMNFSRRSFLSAAATASATAALAPVAARAEGPMGYEPMDLSLFGPEAGMTRLSSNENPYGPSEKALAAIAAAVTKAGEYYPDRSRQKLVEMIAERHGLTPDHVAITTGSGEVLDAIGMAYAAEGDLLGPELFFDGPFNYAVRKGATMHRTPMLANMDIDLDGMQAMVNDGISLVIINNPNNPTGMVADAAKLRAFCKAVAPTATVVLDEAYIELTDDPDANSMVDLVREGENVIVTRTFSKIYGMAGMRIGYSLAKPEITQAISGYTMTWPNVAGLAGAIASYNEWDFLEFSKAKVAEARDMVTSKLDELGFEYLPSGANFVFVDVRENANDVQQRFAERGIQIRGVYGPWTNWSRVSMGKIEDVQLYVDALPEVLGA